MKHILITGGNAGIGYETAKELALRGNKVIIAGRNKSKVETAVKDIKSFSANNDVHSIVCDLSSFQSIKECAANYKEQLGQLDILINNAGLVTNSLQFTSEGFEMQIGVNHLGPFLLTHELLGLLHKSDQPQIINVSSMAHYRGNINFNTFKGEIGSEKYKGMAAYRQSKLANVLFTQEMARRYPDITTHCLHPGVVRTMIGNKAGGLFNKVVWSMAKPFMISVKKGAQTSIYLATNEKVTEVNGKYFDNQKEKKPSSLARDEQLAAKLWEVSSELVGL